MDSVMVGLLVAILISQVFLAVGIGCVAWLCYRTLVRPEAPCYAAAASPRFGMMSIDPSHPAYSALAKKIVTDRGEGAKVDGGNYL